MLASNSPFMMMMIMRMTTMVMMKPQSPLFWAHASKWSSILLHQTCIMSVCFKTHDTVELIGADSCIRGRAECVALGIRCGFYVRRCWFMDVCDFSRPHISSLCVPTCTLISPQFAPSAWLFCQRERERWGKQRLSTFRSTRCFGRRNFPPDRRAAHWRLSLSSFSFLIQPFFSYPSALCFISDLLTIFPVTSSTR